jgi:hypothetical protein
VAPPATAPVSVATYAQNGFDDGGLADPWTAGHDKHLGCQCEPDRGYLAFGKRKTDALLPHRPGPWALSTFPKPKNVLDSGEGTLSSFQNPTVPPTGGFCTRIQHRQIDRVDADSCKFDPVNYGLAGLGIA